MLEYLRWVVDTFSTLSSTGLLTCNSQHLSCYLRHRRLHICKYRISVSLK
jgi:hypothetical protein